MKKSIQEWLDELHEHMMYLESENYHSENAILSEVVEFIEDNKDAPAEVLLEHVLHALTKIGP
jgi:hypothetical protein